MKMAGKNLEKVCTTAVLRFLWAHVRMEDTRLPKRVMSEELVGGVVPVGGQAKEWMGCLLDDLSIFGIDPDMWTIAAQDEGNDTGHENKRRWLS